MTGQTTRIDNLLQRLGAAPPDRTLDQLEPRVWARISAGRRPAMALAWQWRAAIAAAALVIGAASGGAAAARSAPEMAPFSAHSALLPSTLLGTVE